MKKLFIAICLGFCFFATSASAYSPPAPFILGKVLKEREKLKTVELEGRFSSPTSNGWIKESLRIDFTTGKVIAIYSSEAGESLGAKVTKVQDLSVMGRAWIGIGLDPFGNRMRVTLEDLGVYPEEDTSVSIDFVGSNPVWVWGKTSRLKILKDEFLFAGYQSADQNIEVTAFTAKTGGVRLPKTVVLEKSNFTYELKGFRLNAAVKASQGLTPIHSEAVREWVELVR
jgi:hypothetical protein